MSTADPQTALEALGQRRLLVSRWPWRSAGYLLTTVPVALPAVAVLAVPWLVLVAQLGAGHARVGSATLLILLGSATIGALGPLIAPPLARVERRRLRMVDRRAASAGRRYRTSTGLRSRLRVRYADATTWREVGYACLLAAVAPLVSIAALLTIPFALAFLASPILVAAQRPGGRPVALGFGSAATVGQAVPYLIAGVLLLPLIPYLLTLLAGGQAAVARALLTDGSADALRTELVEVSRSRARLVDAFEAERRRIERDLHDGAQQKLVSLTMRLGLARFELPDDSPAAQNVTTAFEQAKELITELRHLIHGIQPQTLTDLGLSAALDELAEGSTIPVTVDAALPARLPSSTENTAYFVAAEALANLTKHSAATSARIAARQDGDQLTIEISDNGRGGADPTRGTGLTGLADRVAAAGGRLLLSSPVGGPTLLRVEIPCTQKPPSA